MSAIRVSAVVPVWNPGPSFIRCIDSLLAQDLPPDEYEIVLVDDGSSDGTAATLDEFAAEHPGLVRVIHTPNSGWPGRPRNIGIEEARGEFVHLVDNDDAVPPYAMRALCEMAEQHGADVAFGTPASDFRGLNQALYRERQWVGTLAERPELTFTLTPHKMFRRAFLAHHGIRFPEGPIPLEDQFFVLAAYLHARAIVVLADRCYYRYLRRLGSGRNAGDRPIDPGVHCGAVGQLIEFVTENVPEGALRDRLLRRFLTINLLPRVSEPAFTDADEQARAALVAEVGGLVEARFDPAVRDGCGAAHRVLIQTLLTGDLTALGRVAHAYQRVAVRVQAIRSEWHGGRWGLELAGSVHVEGEPLRCQPIGDGWALPSALFPDADEDHRRLDDRLDDPDVELALVSRNSAESYGLTGGLRLAVGADGTVAIAGSVEIDPRTVAADRPLEDGLWDLVVKMRWVGWNRSGALTVPADVDVPKPAVGVRGQVLIPIVAGRNRAISLDVGEWHRSLAGPGRRRRGPLRARAGGVIADSPHCRIRILAAARAGAGRPGRQRQVARPVRAADGARRDVSGRLPAPADVAPSALDAVAHAGRRRRPAGAAAVCRDHRLGRGQRRECPEWFGARQRLRRLRARRISVRATGGRRRASPVTAVTLMSRPLFFWSVPSR